jgi:hypothetical protein
MGYIGTPVQQALTKATSQYFNGTGSQTVFTLNRAVNVPEDLEVFVNNIQQEPGVGKSYTATGTTLTFDAAPSSGTGNVYVIYRGLAEVTRRLEHDPNAALAATGLTVDGNSKFGSSAVIPGFAGAKDISLENNVAIRGTNAATTTAFELIKFNTSDQIVINNDGASAVLIPSGNVGIGATSSPVRNVDIASAGTTTASIRSTGTSPAVLYIQNSDTGTGDSDGIYLGRSAAVNYLWTYENEPWVFGANNTERLRISSGGEITYNSDPTFGGGVNVVLSATYNDTSNHAVGGVNTQSFALITINTSNGATHIPVYRNGGAGVAYAGTMLDPDNQTWVALGTSITFNQPGSFPQTFVVSITTGGSLLNVQRTSGSNAYSVFVQLLG